MNVGATVKCIAHCVCIDIHDNEYLCVVMRFVCKTREEVKEYIKSMKKIKKKKTNITAKNW